MSDIHHMAFYRAICLSKVQAGVRVGIITEAKVNIMCDCPGLTLSQYCGKIIGPCRLWDSDDCSLVHEQFVSSGSWPDCYVCLCL